MLGLRTHGRWFRDEAGRTVILRGVNLGGDCKVPYPRGGTDYPGDFSDHRRVSFIGRPFLRKEADEHFQRLRSWGFNCLRLLTTWEAVEHRGPYEFDEDYLGYFTEICRKAGDYGFAVYVDFHQDVWSRMTGGDGAPGWLFEKVGLDYTRFGRADAAVVMQYLYDYDDPAPYQAGYPPMCWSMSRQYPVNGIMWTLFFAGRIFCPLFRLKDEGSGAKVNVQDYLQAHFLASQARVAERLAALPQVIGFGAMNEPAPGWIGQPLSLRPTVHRNEEPIRTGPALSPMDALTLAQGHPLDVPYNAFVWYRRTIRPVRTVTLNPRGVRIWLPDREDPFLEAGAWKRGDHGSCLAGREDFFQVVDGHRLDFNRDCLVPFWREVARNFRRYNPDWLLFALKDPVESMLRPGLPEPLIPGCVSESHWYDPVILYWKRFSRINIDLTNFRLVVGVSGLRKKYRGELSRIAVSAEEQGIPAFLGEFGICFDLRRGRAYRRFAAGDRSSRPWRDHIKALELIYDALDSRILSGTVWNYSATNRNDPRVGDRFNQEDLSIYSQDQHRDSGDPVSGARAPEGWLRPFAPAVQGNPLEMIFHRRKRRFVLRYRADPKVGQPTEIFLPSVQFPRGFQVEVHGEGSRLEQVEAERIAVWADKPSEITIVVDGRRGGRSELSEPGPPA